MTEWATKRAAAEHATVSPDAIAAAVKAGDLPAYAVGKGNRDWRVKLEDVDAWMESRAWEPAK